VLENGDKIQADMTDISKGGIGILYPLAAEKGIELTILFEIPTKQGMVPLKANVIIHYVHFSKNLFHIGLEFQNLDPEILKIISIFIHEKLHQQKDTVDVKTANNKHK